MRTKEKPVKLLIADVVLSPLQVDPERKKADIQ